MTAHERNPALVRIRTAMIEKKLTQAELADAADCHEKTVQNLLQGRPVRDWRRFDLGDRPVRLRLNGAEVAAGSSSDLVFGDPIGAIAWLASQPVLAGRGLKRGDLVMTGTCTGLTQIQAGDRAEADFGELGRVRATFV